MLGGIGGKEGKGTTEDEMAGWHHRLDGHGFGWTLGVGAFKYCHSWVGRVSGWRLEAGCPAQGGTLEVLFQLRGCTILWERLLGLSA